MTAENTSLIGLDVGQIVVLELHSQSLELINGLFNVVDGKVEHGERCRSMVRFRIEKNGTTSCFEFESFGVFRDLQSECLSVKFFSSFDVIHRKTRESFGGPE